MVAPHRSDGRSLHPRFADPGGQPYAAFLNFVRRWFGLPPD